MTDKTVSFEKTFISMSETTNSNAFDLDFESATDNINNQKKEDIEKSNKSTKLVPVELTAVENQFLAEKNSDCEVEVSLRSQSQGTQFKTSIVEDERQHECSKQDNFKEIATGVCDSTVVAPSDLEPVDGRNIYGESDCFDEELSKLTELNDEIEKMFPKETYHIEEKADTFSKEKPNAIDTDIQRSLESSEYNQDENKNVDKTSCVQEPIEIIDNEDALPNENRSPSYDTNGNTNVSREQYKRETEGSCEAQDKDIFEIKCETNRECKPKVNRDVINFELKHLTEDCSHPSVSSRQSRESSKTVQKCVLNTISLETDSNIKPSSQIISTSAKELKTDKNVTSGESTCVYNDVNEMDIENELIDECFVNKQTENSKTETLLKLSDKDLERDSLTMHKEEEEEDTSVNISLNEHIEGDDKLFTIKARCDAIDKQNKLCIDVETCSVQKEEASKHSKPQIKAGRSPTKQVSNSSQSATTGLINSTNVGSEVTSFQKPDDQQEDVQDLRSKLYCKSHHDVVKFWCMDCKKSEKWEKEIQKNSNNCLKVLDHAFKELQRNERESQFQALIQRDRIHQEFISFHHLLIDEENKILKHLEKTLDEHSLQTSESQKKYGSLIDEEASLMCESLRSIDEDDSFDTDLSMEKLENEAIELFSSIQPLPNAINKMFSFKHLKTAIGEHLNLNYQHLSKKQNPSISEYRISTMETIKDVAFSAVKGCKDLYDISPEEMRSLAYRLDKSSYVSLENDLTDTFDVMCSSDEKELLENLNLIYQIKKFDTIGNANVKLDFEMKTVQEQEMEIQRESFNEQLLSLKVEIDSKQYYIDQLKQENEKLSVTVVKLNEDTCKKKHNELESVMMTGKSSHIQNDELEERNLACVKKSTVWEE
ncbi:unnamed protein product [Mytilus edulis]|uniref:Uncharacterized protein n=1 Tax=Mytilus edulis TaxID=6550 RepID=A0A8S3Q2T0_MYTED|nr:unnamed protein product [Mytilus edulis]